MLDRLNGMFAFALHDADRGTLFLARDRLGVKPLHYVELSDGSLAFASELKGLLAHPLVRRSPDLRAVEDYMAWGYVPDDACIVAGVRKLAAGHFLLIERGRGVSCAAAMVGRGFLRTGRGGRRTRSARNCSRRCATGCAAGWSRTFRSARSCRAEWTVRRWLRSWRRTSRSAVKTCTIGFAEADHDERRYADQVAAALCDRSCDADRVVGRSRADRHAGRQFRRAVCGCVGARDLSGVCAWPAKA